MSTFWHNHKWNLACFVAVVVFVVLSTGSALHESLVYDEIFYIQEGTRNLTERIFSDPYNPPLIRELTAIPLVFFPFVFPQSDITAIRYLPARLVTITLGVLLLVSVYIFVKRRFDGRTGFVAGAVLALEPTVLAHSHYVTSDIGLTLFFFWAYWAWLILLRRQTWTGAGVFGISAGLAFASKLSAIPYILVSAVASLFITRKIAGYGWLWQKQHFMIASFTIALFVVWATYSFQNNVIIAKRDDTARMSERIIRYASEKNLPVVGRIISVLQSQPIPLGDYFATMKNSFLRPQVAPEARQGSLAKVLLLKVPIPLMILAIVGLLQPHTAIYTVPLFFVFIVSLYGSPMPWVRYVLPIYPFIAIVAAIGIRAVGQKRGMWGIVRSIALFMSLIWYILGSVSSYPHFVSYANEFAGPADRRYEVLTDSNLDWGQGLPDMADFMRQEKLGHLSFSYFGRDNGNPYGLISNREWGSHQFGDICAFHEIVSPYATSNRMIAISVSNWYGCGYSKSDQFSKQKIRLVIADSILIF
ncbi:glycosyltransferase family 39 protein [Candidatus Gottesmanbacteria bacterium]|nr:glycosyltransferase family 39 protein [Candidatus Gottesmanbacteria bacterium]